MCGFFKRNCLGLLKFLPTTLSPLVFAARSMGTYLPGTGTLGWGSCYGAGTPHSRDYPPKFLSTTCVCGTSPFCIFSPPTSLDRCGFFNSVIVRFPFNLISAGSEWWLFYNLVVILTWLCEEVSGVHLCHHLDQSLSWLIAESSCLLSVHCGIYNKALKSASSGIIFVKHLVHCLTSHSISVNSNCYYPCYPHHIVFSPN